jgi:hypothetical protein
MTVMTVLERQRGFLPEPSRRGRLLLAIAIDLMTLVLACTAAAAIAFAWMLFTTDAGAVDVAERDAVLAVAFAAAALPAWTSWQWCLLWRQHATFGASRLLADGLAMLPARRRATGLVLHPVAAPAWAWLAAFMLVVMAPIVSYALFVLCLVVTGMAFASSLLLLARPSAAPLHWRLASMRVRRNA